MCITTFCANGDELDTLAGNEVECLVHIGNLVEPHLAPVRFGESFSRDDLKEEHELQPISKIFFNVLNLSASLAQMWVDPGSKSLKINDYLSLIINNNKIIEKIQAYWLPSAPKLTTPCPHQPTCSVQLQSYPFSANLLSWGAKRTLKFAIGVKTLATTQN